MNILVIVAIVAAVAFSTLFIVLLWYNIYKKLFTFNDLSTPAATEMNNGPITSPMIYQLVYQSSSNTTWKFDQSEQFASDWRKGRINYLLIAGTMYLVQSVALTLNTMTLQLVSSCDNSSSSFAASTSACIAPSFAAKNTLLVLGYKFTI